MFAISKRVCFDFDNELLERQSIVMLVSFCRYGIKGPVYLRSKEGDVVYMTDTDEPLWTSGTLWKHDTHVLVDSVLGQQIYRLLDHITVKLA